MNAIHPIAAPDERRKREARQRAAIRDDPRRGVIILGGGQLAATIASHLKNATHSRYRFVGCLDGAVAGHANGFVIGSLKHLREIAAQRGIDCVIVALSERRGVFPAEDLLFCRTNGIRVEDGVTFYERVSGRIPLAGLNPSSLIFSDGFNRLRVTMICKRFIDVLVSCVGLMVALPVFLVLPIVIRLDSRGPAIFRQERVGQHGRSFRFLKFRTMRWEPRSNGDQRWTNERDARLTRVGRLIRRLRLDELPQLWNVLKGDLCFVGPRPDVPSLRDTLKEGVPYYSLRTAIKPGITGWAQVRYHYVSSVQQGIERHEFDLYYIKNMSLLLDLRILVETFKIVVLGQGAR